jgi:ubiquinone/menaquinone biosynthesis C-methylase UbiE
MSDKQSVEHYRGEAGRVYHERKRGIPDAAFNWVANLRAEKISAFVKRTDVVFEYGVGWGWNLAALQCAKKIGFDISEVLAQKVKDRGIDFVSSPQLMPDASADVIVCHHTLEHLLNPVTALNEMRRILNPNGKLLLFVPFERESKYTRFDAVEPNHHLYSWNAQTLGNLVQETGYKVLRAKIAPFGYDRFAAVWATRSKTGNLGFSFIRAGAHAVKPAFEVRVVAEPVVK